MAVEGAVQEGAGHAEAAFEAGPFIMHHIVDSREVEIPFVGYVHLPEWQLFGQDLSLTRAVIMMWIAAVILLVLFRLAVRNARNPVPSGIRNALEALILFVRDEIARKNIGHEGDRYVPYLLTTFFFVLACNLLGLVPGMATATGAISVTAALALVAFGMTQWAGIREHGLAGHFGHLVPPGLPKLLIPLLLPVEILGMFTKPFALCIRLFANMTAGHVVILSLFGIIFMMQSVWWAGMSVPFALFIYLLEILVCFLQAYIFTMLTSLFIGMSVHPAH